MIDDELKDHNIRKKDDKEGEIRITRRNNVIYRRKKTEKLRQ